MVGVGAFALPAAFDAIPSTESIISSIQSTDDALVTLSEHIAAAICVAGVGYWWLFGHKRQKALRSYRLRLFESPRRFVDWYGGEVPTRAATAGGTGREETRAARRACGLGNLSLLRFRSPAPELPRLRRRSCERLGDEIIRSGGPAVAIVKGRAGTGKTDFILELVDYLAGKGLIPIPLLARHGQPFDLEEQAKAKFFRNIEFSADSGEQVDAIWHFARQTRGIVVLVDGLDKELFQELEGDEEKRAASAISDLQSNQIHLVLATTLDLDVDFNVEDKLGLERIPSLLREDLDRFTRPEAREYLDRALESLDRIGEGERRQALNALGQPQAGREDSQVDPFYLDLLVRLTARKLLGDMWSGTPRPQSDRWRCDILERYLDAVRAEKFESRLEPRLSDLDRSPSQSRSRQAYAAAIAVAELLQVPHDLTVGREELVNVAPDALADAKELNLLRVGPQRVSFTSDDLGAYLFARTQRSSAGLLGIVRKVANDQVRSLRHQRFALTALTFWHLEHPGEQRRRTFAKLLDTIERPERQRPWLTAAALRRLNAWQLGPAAEERLHALGELVSPEQSPEHSRPRLAAAVLRIYNDCGDLEAHRGRVAAIVRRSVETLTAARTPTSPDHDPSGAVRLVRALSEWEDRERPRLLWRLACSRNLEVEWPAVKALAALPDPPLTDPEIDAILERASGPHRASLSDESSPVGNELASLAWLLPAMRLPDARSDHPREQQWRRVKLICLDDELSPLRGQMAIAQGVKLAALMKGDVAPEELEELLLDQRPDFWHARLVLVQAVLAQAWQTPNRKSYARLLRRLHASEDHPLTRRAIALAIEGLAEAGRLSRRDPAAERDLDGPATQQMYEYMWPHEHDAVTRVEQRKWKVSRLAADVVLLSNMTYDLWKVDRQGAERCARALTLPGCIESSAKRASMIRSPASLCACPLCSCGNWSAVRGTWARFTEGFCREQARLVALHGPPSWVRGRRGSSREQSEKLRGYWRDEAELLSRWRRGDGSEVLAGGRPARLARSERPVSSRNGGSAGAARAGAARIAARDPSANGTAGGVDRDPAGLLPAGGAAARRGTAAIARGPA